MRSFLLATVLIISHSVFSQCDFFDDYTTNSGWAQVGNDVEVINGHVEFINGAIGGEGPGGDGQKRVYKSLGSTLNASDYWVAQFDFTPVSVGSTQGQPWTGHTLFGLTAGTQEPFSDCTNLACTGFPTGTQDGIIAYFGADNPPTGDIWFKIKAKDGTQEYTSNQINCVALNTTYYPRIERTSATNVVLAIYSDAARTTQIPGSPVSLTIPNTITGLTTIQHGNAVRGNYQRALNGSIDNLCINFSPLSVKSETENNDGNLIVYPNPSSDQLTINANMDIHSIQIIDITGKTVKSFNNKLTTIDIANLSAGVYFIQLIGEENTITKKFVKQ